MAVVDHAESGGTTYRVGDALDELRELPDESAKLVHLDDAWARPKRCDGMGVEYPTHDLDTSYALIDECWRVLRSDGWLIADADDWYKLQLESYLCEECGNVAATYEGGGYRRTGTVTYQRADGGVDRGGAGMYLRNAGYHVVFGTKPDVDHVYEAARQFSPRPSETFGWHSVKPLEPYAAWVEAICEPGDHIVIPCAGTAPAAIAAERAFGRDARVTCIDIKPDAKEAFERRREAELGELAQASFAEGWA